MPHDIQFARAQILGISKGPSVPIWAVVLLAVVGTVVAALGTMYLFSYRRSTKAASKHGRSSGSSVRLLSLPPPHMLLPHCMPQQNGAAHQLLRSALKIASRNIWSAFKYTDVK